MKAAILCLSLLVLLVINPSYGAVSPVFDFSFGASGTGNGQFNAPEDVAIDSFGNIYVVDTGNNRIQKFDSAGNYLSKFGSSGTSNGRFRAPSGIALDSSGNIYVADTNNNRIQKFDSAGVYLSKFGSGGTANGRFNAPDDLTIDSSGNIYVVDTGNNRIQKFDSAGVYLSKFGSSGSGDGQFNAPSAIALDSSGNIYVADTNNHRIQKFNSAGTYLSKFGSSGSGNGQFTVPQGVSLDNYGNIMVSDTGNHRIQKFTSSGSFVLSFGSFGTGSEQFNYQQQITMNGLQGFVADTSNHRMWVFHFPESPVADNQHVATLEETPLSITLTASDVNNDSLTYSIVGPPSHGSLSGVAPALTYTPNTNYFGADSFTFKANDGTNDSNTATIEIDVGNINDAPTTSGQSVTTNEDAQKAITVTAADADGNILQYVIVSPAQYGSISGTLPNITYTPNLNYFGSDSFSFKVNDGLVDSNTSTISITINPVNDAPVAYDVNATLNEDTPIHTSSIPYQQTDVENDPVSFIIVTPLTHGDLSGDPLDLIYTPDSNYYGDDCFTFKFNDGEFDSNVATGCAIILPVNDPPVSSSQSVQTNEDTPRNITLNATDIENDSLTYQIFSQPSSGVLTGTAPNLTYTPNQNHYGSDSFKFRAYDGAEYSISSTISITINPINDAPVAYSMNFTTPEDTPFVNASIVASDAEGDPLTYILVTPQVHGNLTGTAPFMTYTPNTDYVGSDSLTFKVNDGEFDSNVATLSMEVGPLEDQPTTYAQSVTTDEDVPVNITLAAFDADDDALTYSIVASPTHGSISGVLPNITYTPAQNDYGTDSFSFKVNDGLMDSNTSTISITINPINDAPIAYDVSINMYEDTPEDVFNAIIQSYSDVENDSLTPIEVTPIAHGELVGEFPNLTYVPELNYYGTDCITFKFNDGEFDSNIATGCVNILPVNDPPVADDQQITLELNTLQHIELTAFDIENDTLAYTIISQPSHGILSEEAPHISYLPNRNYVGTDEFTFKASDGNATSLPATVSLTITQITEEETTTSDSGRFTVTSIPRISEFGIYDDSQSVVSSLFGSQKTLTIETDQKITLRAILDDEESSTNIIHFGLYTNVQNTGIQNSDAYVIFDGGSSKIVDEQGLFSDAQINTSHLGKSMIVDVDLTFEKPMKTSDVILEVWNHGRNAVYETIPFALKVVESNKSGPNISGSVNVPESKSKEPIQVFSVASGKVTEIKNDGVLVLPNKDMTVRISGFIDGVQRGEKAHIAILHPDDSTYMTDAFVNEDGAYMMLTKLNTKWESGHYEIQVNCMDEDLGVLQFFVTDTESTDGQFGVILDHANALPSICKYHHGEMTKEDLVSYLKEIGWSQKRIDSVLLKHRPAYINPYTFYYLAGLVPLLYVLVSYLSKDKKRNHKVE